MSEPLCSGSGGPPVWPLVRRRPMTEAVKCPACGGFARPFMRRMDWSGPNDLYLDDHAAVAAGDAPETVELKPGPYKTAPAPTGSPRPTGAGA